MSSDISILGVIGECGSKEVFLGFAPASILHQVSFADILDEETGEGYQRRFNIKHSLDFKKYIQLDGSTTIPLTFNLRPENQASWKLEILKNGQAKLTILNTEDKFLSQVDCQHRLGFLDDVDTPLAFMTYIGLSEIEEMAVFNTINGKAKGLNSSLLDFHDAKLAEDLGKDRPELYIALRLSEDEASPWCKRIDLGGKNSSGMKRKASLRTIQKAVKKFLHETGLHKADNPDIPYSVLLNFWQAVTLLLQEHWDNPRNNFVTKGIGVYSLNYIAADLYIEANRSNSSCDYNYFISRLSSFINELDWSNTGPFKGLGGESGALEAANILRALRDGTRLTAVNNG